MTRKIFLSVFLLRIGVTLSVRHFPCIHSQLFSPSHSFPSQGVEMSPSTLKEEEEEKSQKKSQRKNRPAGSHIKGGEGKKKGQEGG